MKKNLVRFFRKIKILRSKLGSLASGFTLIELVIGVVIAILVLIPLTQFMIDILNSDYKEQAKTTSQQEIQLALDYIAKDLEQAVYIYNADSLYGSSNSPYSNGSNTTYSTLSGATVNGIYGSTTSSTSSTTSSTSSTSPQIIGGGTTLPTTEQTVTPVLAFWKRYIYKSTQNVTITNNGTTTNKTVGCLTNSSFTSTITNGTNTTTNTCSNQDYLVYSLVVYYLVNNNTPDLMWNPTGNPWNSSSQRIVRWEIRDGIHDSSGSLQRIEPNSSLTSSSSSSTACGSTSGTSSSNGTTNGTTIVACYDLLPDNNFYPFTVTTSGNLTVQLANWTNLSNTCTADKVTCSSFATSYINTSTTPNSFYTQPVTLIDYVDATPTLSSTTSPCNTNEQQVPSYNTLNSVTTGTITSPVHSSFATYSFFACVNSSNNAITARVFIRGNAANRIALSSGSLPASYFPTTSIEVKARGFLGNS